LQKKPRPKSKERRQAMSKEESVSWSHERWAYFRFSVVGPLLAAPPGTGELINAFKALAQKIWRHPITDKAVQFGFSTIERWYYQALNEKQDPVRALKRKRRRDADTYPSLSLPLQVALKAQYRQHLSWSCRLHFDNLAVLVAKEPALGPLPSYPSVLRFMKARGLLKQPRRGSVGSPGSVKAEERFLGREIRSYESEYVNALWHLDFHHGSLRVLTTLGQWVYPVVLGILDDYSRLCCHIQWYLAETAENLVHGLSQALQKRGLPRALMSDNGSPMIAAETTEGLQRLGILHEKTLAYSPYQNGKQESFWGQLEGRLMAMLEGERDLTLARLNEATLAWAEMEYNRKVHSETGGKPVERFIAGKDVGRPCPSSRELQQAFTAAVVRSQRRSDGTISLAGGRFEVPARYNHFARITARFASWDLTQVYMCEPHTGALLCRIYPLDKSKNADAYRRAKDHAASLPPNQTAPTNNIAPLLRQLIERYAATGLPPAYLPKDDQNQKQENQK
jgi:transposase InsO family protein